MLFEKQSARRTTLDQRLEAEPPWSAQGPRKGAGGDRAHQHEPGHGHVARRGMLAWLGWMDKEAGDPGRPRSLRRRPATSTLWTPLHLVIG